MKGIQLVMGKTKTCSDHLKAWNKSSFGSVKKKLQEAKQNLERVTQMDSLCLRPTDHAKARGEVHR